MDEAIPIPAPISRQATDLARRLRKSLNQLVADALSEYIARHDPDTITERLDAVHGDLADDEREDRFVSETVRHALRQVEW